MYEYTLRTVIHVACFISDKPAAWYIVHTLSINYDHELAYYNYYYICIYINVCDVRF